VKKDFYNSRDVRTLLHGKAEPVVIDAIASAFELINGVHASLRQMSQSIQGWIDAARLQNAAMEMTVEKLDNLAKVVGYEDKR